MEKEVNVKEVNVKEVNVKEVKVLNVKEKVSQEEEIRSKYILKII